MNNPLQTVNSFSTSLNLFNEVCKISNESNISNTFSNLLEQELQEKHENIPEHELFNPNIKLYDSRLPGDYVNSFKKNNATIEDTQVAARGAAANSGMHGSIDKTSALYEQALELESFFVKIMLSSMRATINQSSITGENSFASGMYQDMLYDQLSRDLTQNAGFGLADQIYIQLA